MRLAVTRYDHDESSHVLSEVLKNAMHNDTIIVCIGTDRAIGDALAPVVGTMLKSRGFRYSVYGTLDRPIHALNIYESVNMVKQKHPNSTIIAIDACLGKKESIGNVAIRNTAIKPGKGVGKRLPEIGDYSIIGIVGEINNTRDFNNIRLDFIINMAESICESLLLAAS